MNHGLQVASWMGAAIPILLGMLYRQVPQDSTAMRKNCRYRRGLPYNLLCSFFFVFLLLVDGGDHSFLRCIACDTSKSLLGYYCLDDCDTTFNLCAFSPHAFPGVYDGRSIADFVEQNVSADRANSLRHRLNNEDMLLSRAFESPLFGWGGWGRNRVYDENGKDLTVTDGLWIIIIVQKAGRSHILLCHAYLGTVLSLIGIRARDLADDFASST